MKLRVLKNLRITESDLDPDSRGGRAVPSLIGAVYIAGDTIEVTEAEAGALLLLFPDHFEQAKQKK